MRCPLDWDDIPLGQLFMAAAFFINLLVLTRLYYAIRTINGRVTILSGLVREFGRRLREQAALDSVEIEDGGVAPARDALALLEKADAELQGQLGNSFRLGFSKGAASTDVMDFLTNLPAAVTQAPVTNTRPPTRAPVPVDAPPVNLRTTPPPPSASQPARSLDQVQAEKRRHPRASLTARVQFRFNTPEAFQEAFSRDISEGGVFVKTLQPRPVGTRVFVQVALDASGSLRQCQAHVVRVEQGVGMALAFDVMDEATREALHELITPQVGPG